MSIDYPWIVFFSRTGSEITNLIVHYNRIPDAIITNRQGIEGIEPHLKNLLNEGKLNWVVIPKNPSVSDYKKALKPFKDPLITLHGYLRIIPKEICKKYKIYNLHPGLITMYPELRGKDPQVRAVQASHKIAGVVIHEVVPEVDAGKIIHDHAINIQGLTEEEVIRGLHSLASAVWYKFFDNYEHRRNSKRN